jgi:hypothetical protein
MAEFVFTSPGLKFKERDLTFVTRNVGITTLGLVGETLKGPAFEPVFIQDKTQFADRFGGQSANRFPEGNLQYQLPYVANTYLEESNQLWVTRVLGLSGYNAGKAWAVTLNAGVDPSTIAIDTVLAPYSASFTENAYLGVTLNASGDTGVSFSGFEKINDTDFTGTSYSFIVTSYTASTGSGVVSVTATTFTGTEYTDYKNMVLAVIRSRGIVIDNVNLPATTTWQTSTLGLSANTTNLGTGDLFGTFKLTATSGTSETYVVSLNPDASSFIPNVIGFEPKDKNTKIWVEAVYPDLIKKIDSFGDSILSYPATSGFTSYGIPTTLPYAYGINDNLLVCGTTSGSDNFSNYKTQYKTPETPWVVSQVKGNAVSRLFKFISISDGDAANEEIKISIANINPATLEFDIQIRSFYDTDDNINLLESFTKCTLIKGQNSFIGQRIGTSDGEYDLLSKYVMVELASDLTVGDFPAGFEGFLFTNFAQSATTGSYEAIAPKIFYKTYYDYNAGDKVKKVYLGVSENAYDTDNVVGTGINQNFFNFNGLDGTHVNSEGFHMDKYASGVTSNGFSFQCGIDKFQTYADVSSPTSEYYLLASRKFTLVPFGGFDGWNVNRNNRSYDDGFQQNGIFDGVAINVIPNNDFQAWQTAINTFANPEKVTINLFATPGIDWSSQNILVQDTIEMIETQRADTLYVIDSPDVNIPVTVGENKADVVASEDIVDLLDTADIDSSYSCTYFPWIQVRDTQNNINVYIPPTGEVVRAMAFTDNTAFPWFAPAGLNRGVTNARKSKYKISQEASDILYAGRINPIKDFAETGTAIFGQKTLQVKDSALNRINVRRLLLQIKVLISNIAIRLVFEQNDQTTIDQFLAKATPVLDTIKRERGLYDFRIKMDDSNNTPETRDRNELYGEIFLKPTRAVEFIGITFTITPSGASFADVGA